MRRRGLCLPVAGVKGNNGGMGQACPFGKVGRFPARKLEHLVQHREAVKFSRFGFWKRCWGSSRGRARQSGKGGHPSHFPIIVVLFLTIPQTNKLQSKPSVSTTALCSYSLGIFLLDSFVPLGLGTSSRKLQTSRRT